MCFLTLYPFWNAKQARACAVALLPYVSYGKTFIKTLLPFPLTVPLLDIVWLRHRRAIRHFTATAPAATLLPPPPPRARAIRRVCLSGYTHTRPMCVGKLCFDFLQDIFGMQLLPGFLAPKWEAGGADDTGCVAGACRILLVYFYLGGPLRTCQNCHSSHMGTTRKRGLKNHFEKLHNCALQGTPLKSRELSKMTVCRGYHMCQSKFMHPFQIWALQCPSEEKSNSSMSSAGAFQTTLQNAT